ncbi:MAG TPA: hypothetical protein VNI84_03460 [Pyrinomonadaceae bacterium]|nr:hypothetical protein [Pyrinomonadaceae bacterium]
MNYFRLILIAAIALGFSVGASAQTNGKKVSTPNPPATNQAAKSSPAYAEILLEKTELESQLEDLLVGFTDDFPKVKELRFQINLLQKQADRLLAVGSADTNKLTVALGKLIVRKVELETALWSLKAQYNDDFPEVKRAKRKVEVFEKAIGEILP